MIKELFEKKKRVFLISNMYPSIENVRYGIFVKNFEDAILDDYRVDKIVLTKKKNNFNKLIGYIVLYFKILQLVYKAKKEDVIYVHFPLHVSPVLLVLLIFSKKMVLNFHGSDLIFNSKFTKFLSFFLVPIIKNTPLVVPSNYYKEKVVGDFGVLADNVLIYPSGGVDCKVFYKKRITNNNFVLGYVSNFIPEKGWGLLLDSIQSIINNNNIENLELIMVGDGPDIVKVKNKIRTLNIKVKIFSNLKQNELCQKYNELDLFVFPTYREAESLGLVGIEAMACGVPVIAGKVGGPMGYIKNGYNGYLFEKKNSIDLTHKIMTFYNLTEEEKKQLSDNCIETAKLYDSIVVKKQLLSFLELIE